MSVISIANGAARELNQGGTSTAETVFTTNGTIPVVLPFLTAEQLVAANGRGTIRVHVSCGGRVTGGTTTNFTGILLWGTSATATSNTDLETTGAVAVNSLNSQWCVEADLLFDITSGKINGRGWGIVEGTVTAAAATAQITGIDPDGNGTLGFTASGTFSSGNAGNLAYLDWFTLSVLE